MDVSLSELRELVMAREAWRAAIHGVAKSRTRLSDRSDLISPLSLPKKSLYLHLVSALLLETHSFLDQLFLYVCLSGCLPVTSAPGQGLTVSHGARHRTLPMVDCDLSVCGSSESRGPKAGWGHTGFISWSCLLGAMWTDEPLPCVCDRHSVMFNCLWPHGL